MSDDIETPKIGKGLAGPGRPKGMPNKTTALLKDAILAAAQLAGGEATDSSPGGMIGYLREQALANPGPFMALLGKVLPTQLANDEDNPLTLVARIELVAPKSK